MYLHHINSLADGHCCLNLVLRIFKLLQYWFVLFGFLLLACKTVTAVCVLKLCQIYLFKLVFWWSLYSLLYIMIMSFSNSGSLMDSAIIEMFFACFYCPTLLVRTLNTGLNERWWWSVLSCSELRKNLAFLSLSWCLLWYLLCGNIFLR